MRIWSRLAAIAVISVPFTRWMTGQEAREMAHYRTLDRESLLAALQAHHRAGTAGSYVAMFIALGLCFVAVQGVAALIERVTGAPRADHD
ncbi:MAG TPA: hypothetical protein VKZ18_14665 [Polyangia bacterium]|nr:hypothetical protein [Polyangia bacterium]